jgi:serine/threonine-protein kinase
MLAYGDVPAPAPGNGAAWAATILGPAGAPATPEPLVPATTGFEATLLGGPSLPSLEATQGASELVAPASLQGPVSASPSGSGPRSTVLPRVEVQGGQPRILVQDRPRYQETRRLGEGGVGEVVMARDNDIERHVAVKRLRPELQGTTALARFVEEIRVVGQLEHPSIVPIHDVGLDERGQFYFVMKYVNGETLEHIIQKLAENDPVYHARYPFGRRVEIFIAILEAMAYAHDKGYIHRDIKPANVMVGPYGEVMVMDWGLAKKVGGEIDHALAMPEADGNARNSGRLQETRVGSILGTPLYMSPEQARGQHHTLDQRCDIYSLCMLFLELLTTRHPLQHHTNLNQVLLSVASEPPITPIDKLWEANPTQGPVPADLRHITVKGLQKSPEQRYASVHELIARLQRRAEGCVDVECPVTFWMSMMSRGRRTIERHPVLGVSLVSLFVLTSAVSLIYSAMHLLRA